MQGTFPYPGFKPSHNLTDGAVSGPVLTQPQEANPLQSPNHFFNQRDSVLPEWAYDLPDGVSLSDVDPALAMAYSAASGDGLNASCSREMTELQSLVQSFQSSGGDLEGDDLPMLRAEQIDLKALGRLVNCMKTR